MPFTYTPNEYVDMLIIYGECRKNSREAANLYRERFPERTPPSHTTVRKIEAQLRTESFPSTVKHTNLFALLYFGSTYLVDDNSIIPSILIMTEERTVLQGNGEFTKKLYTILAETPGNVFFSPISIHAILSLAYQGASGQTQEALTKVLNVPNARVAAEGYKEIMSRLNTVKNVTLHMANKLFLQDGYKLQERFKSVAVQQFLSDIDLLNFRQAAPAVATINSWVEKQTNKKIRDLINEDDVTESTVLVLVNAIYFKGKWAEPFDVKNTRTEKFHLNSNDTVHVQMMHITNDFFYKYDEYLEAQVLELPYSNKNISLIIILPKRSNGIAELEKKLAGTNLTTITENMYQLEVKVALPKFKIEKTIDLGDTLTKLGLGVIFSDSAQFPGIIDSPKPLKVSKVIQKAFIEVNEEGTEAAAATGLQYMMMCMPPPPKEFNADHPFFIILRSNQNTQTNVLFGGRVSKPEC